MYKTLKEQEAAKRREALAREGLGNILPIAGEDIFDLNRFFGGHTAHDCHGRAEGFVSRWICG